MGGAMVRGWARSGRLQGVEIAVANPSEGKLKALAAEIPGLVTAPPASSLKSCRR